MVMLASGVFGILVLVYGIQGMGWCPSIRCGMHSHRLYGLSEIECVGFTSSDPKNNFNDIICA